MMKNISKRRHSEHSVMIRSSDLPELFTKNRRVSDLTTTRSQKSETTTKRRYSESCKRRRSSDNTKRCYKDDDRFTYRPFYPSTMVIDPISNEDVLYREYIYTDSPILSQMYGNYTKEFGINSAKKTYATGKYKEGYDRGRCTDAFMHLLAIIWNNTFAKLGEDWVFLALLGVVMAILSFFVDYAINFANDGRIYMFRDLEGYVIAQYIGWVTLPICLIVFAAGFVHLVAPQSIGSGIPEMKTILRGVSLKEYLTLRTLIAKVVGLSASLGSGLPLGKEGPFVHIASIVATLISTMITSFKTIYENESRCNEMLSAACAVGVASTFGAPLGGVLMSIEVTTAYFAIRNYWRGFFTAVCGATVFRLLAVLFNKADTVKAYFPTHFTMEYPFDPQELMVFAFIGIVAGFGGAFYVWFHREYVLLMRKSQKLNEFLQKNRFLYPSLVTFVTTSVTFPHGLGKYCAGVLTTDEQLSDLFSNFTWTKDEFTVYEEEILTHWSTKTSGIFVSLTGYMIYYFVFSIICSTIPVPAGSYIPVFKIGAAFGRMVGELIHMQYPNGVRSGKYNTPIIPGGYATVGAAAFSGAVTHSFSVSVITFEMTGQITHIIPMMVAVLVSNAVAALLQPSIYDSIILIKKLPYLPDLLPSNSAIYNVNVEDFMLSDVKFVWNNMTYRQLKELLREYKRIRIFPLVDNPYSMILLGSIHRLELIRLIEEHIGRKRRMQVAAQWRQQEQERLMELEEKKKVEEQPRKQSRFQVIPVDVENDGVTDSDVESIDALSEPRTPKSILKKTASMEIIEMNNMKNNNNGDTTPYNTVTGTETKIKTAFDMIFRKSTSLRDAAEQIELGLNDAESKPGSSASLNFKKLRLSKKRVFDMSPEDQREWEESEMDLEVNFNQCHIDPAPFQLVERTSLLKVHSIFSLVGVNIAYVTAVGRLKGVVGLIELRRAIEDTNSGAIPTSPSVPLQETKFNFPAAPSLGNPGPSTSKYDFGDSSQNTRNLNNRIYCNEDYHINGG